MVLKTPVRTSTVASETGTEVSVSELAVVMHDGDLIHQQGTRVLLLYSAIHSIKTQGGFRSRLCPYTHDYRIHSPLESFTFLLSLHSVFFLPSVMSHKYSDETRGVRVRMTSEDPILKTYFVRGSTRWTLHFFD